MKWTSTGSLRSLDSIRSSTSGICMPDAEADDHFSKLDKRRKKILHTQACDGTWHLLLSISPSVLPYVLVSVDFWLSVFIYSSGRLIFVFGLIEPIALGNFSGLATLGFLLALMLNFYVNTSITRLFETNKEAMTLIREINDVALILRGYLWHSMEQKDLARRCVDYMCAAHVHCYIGFTKTYTAQNLWKGFNDELGVLTEQEAGLVCKHREHGGSRMRECLCWVVQGISLAESKGWMKSPVAVEVNTIVAEFCDACQALYDFRYLPIPFVSEHLLVFFIHIYLPIQTFEMAAQASILKKGVEDTPTLVVIEVFGCILALLANVGMQGLLAVGAFLEQPYEGGLCHARVSTFCRLATKEARKTLASGNPWKNIMPDKETKSLWTELSLRLEEEGKTAKASLGIRSLQAQLCNTFRKTNEMIKLGLRHETYWPHSSEGEGDEEASGSDGIVQPVNDSANGSAADGHVDADLTESDTCLEGPCATEQNQTSDLVNPHLLGVAKPLGSQKSNGPVADLLGRSTDEYKSLLENTDEPSSNTLPASPGDVDVISTRCMI